MMGFSTNPGRDRIAFVLLALGVAFGVWSIGSYLQHASYVGALVTLGLVLIGAAGAMSFGRALQRLRNEAASLDKSAVATTLEARIRALAERGIEARYDALSREAHNLVREHAAWGKYFVAVTVLVGLVGTFAGLTEALSGFGPLLQDNKISLSQAIAGPLAGLDVTFGASIVAILLTLGLTLLQGDCVFAEERLLAALDDRAAHVWIPQYYPKTESKLVLAVELLTQKIGEQQAALERGLLGAFEQSGAKVQSALMEAMLERAQTAQVALDNAFNQTRASLEVVAKTSADAITQAVERAAEREERNAKGWSEALKLATERLTKISDDATHTLSEMALKAADRITEAHTLSTADFAKAAADATASIAQSTKAASEALAASSKQSLEAMALASKESSEAIALASKHAGDSVARAVTLTADTLAGAAEAVSEATTQLTGSSNESLEKTAEKALEAVQMSVQEATTAIAAASTAASKVSSEGVEMAAAKIAEAAERALEPMRQSIDETTVAAVAKLTQIAESFTVAIEAHASKTNESLQTGTDRLAAAATALGTATEGIRPAADRLTTELFPQVKALTEQVALLAQERASTDVEAATFSELSRLGDSLEEMRALVAMSRAGSTSNAANDA